MRHFLHTTLTSRAKHDTRGERESSCHLHGQNPYTNLQVESAFKLIPNTAPSMLGPASRLLATNSHATSTCFTKPDQLSVACHTSTTFHDQVYLSLPKISSNSCSHSPPELSRSRFPSLPLHLPPRPPLAGSPSLPPNSPDPLDDDPHCSHPPRNLPPPPHPAAPQEPLNIPKAPGSSGMTPLDTVPPANPSATPPTDCKSSSLPAGDRICTSVQTCIYRTDCRTSTEDSPATIAQRTPPHLSARPPSPQQSTSRTNPCTHRTPTLSPHHPARPRIILTGRKGRPMGLKWHVGDGVARSFG